MLELSNGLSLRAALETSGLVPLDASILLGHVLGKDRAWLTAHSGDLIASADLQRFLALVRRRREGEPVAYLTEVREFWGLPLRVSPAVLIPRPETETLVELALCVLPLGADRRVLDLGTGSGAIVLALAKARPSAKLLATDSSIAALDLARFNAQQLCLSNVEFLDSDWFVSVPRMFHDRSFDLIVSNPPYIGADDSHLRVGDLRFEPLVALSPGNDGLSAIRRIIGAAGAFLAPGGVLALEHGYDQAAAVEDLFAAAGYSDVISLCDLAGIPRVAGGRWPG